MPRYLKLDTARYFFVHIVSIPSLGYISQLGELFNKAIWKFNVQVLNPCERNTGCLWKKHVWVHGLLRYKTQRKHTKDYNGRQTIPTVAKVAFKMRGSMLLLIEETATVVRRPRSGNKTRSRFELRKWERHPMSPLALQPRLFTTSLFLRGHTHQLCNDPYHNFSKNWSKVISIDSLFGRLWNEGSIANRRLPLRRVYWHQNLYNALPRTPNTKSMPYSPRDQFFLIQRIYKSQYYNS